MKNLKLYPEINFEVNTENATSTKYFLNWSGGMYFNLLNSDIFLMIV